MPAGFLQQNEKLRAMVRTSGCASGTTGSRNPGESLLEPSFLSFSWFTSRAQWRAIFCFAPQSSDVISTVPPYASGHLCQKMRTVSFCSSSFRALLASPVPLFLSARLDARYARLGNFAKGKERAVLKCKKRHVGGNNKLSRGTCRVGAYMFLEYEPQTLFREFSYISLWYKNES